MSNKVTDLWKAVLGQLELSMSGAIFNTWVKTLELESIDLSVATISTPNFMSKSYVEEKLSDVILAALSSSNPSITSIKYEVKKSSKKDRALEEFFETKAQDNEKEKSTPVVSQKPVSTPAKVNNSTVQTSLQASYTFDNFIAGSSNMLALSAAKRVAEKPGMAYNPLFLHGPAGVGKTHLMWAIRNKIASENPESTCIYITSEEFINEYVNAVRKGNSFTNKYREADVLFVDDTQFMAGKERTQEEFFHTFNALHQNAKQIVLCSDRPPKEIPTLEERLRSRFEWGMVADIAPPDIETRIAILLNKAASQDVILDQETAEYIASSVENNIRELEGALTKVIGYSLAHESDIDINIAQAVLGGTITKKPTLNARGILEKTAQYYEISLADMIGVKRDKEIVLPRQIAMYIMRMDLSLSYPKIASNLGGKDHTTIMHGVKKIEKLYKADSDFANEVNQLVNFIKA